MLSEWPTEAEAAAMLGTSVKTISRYASQGKIEILKRPRPGKKPENVCNPQDVEKLKPTAHVMPESGLALVPNGNHPVRRASSEFVPLVPALGALIETISTAIQTMRTEPDGNGKLWLTIEEAQSYSGLCRKDLLRLCRDGKLEARKSPGWRIRRASLEAFAG
jgi:hypothetical protein